MKDLIAVLIYVVLFGLCIALFVNLLPILIVVLIVFMVMRYFREKKQSEQTKEFFEENVNSYDTYGNIKSDVIDVEYKETVEK